MKFIDNGKGELIMTFEWNDDASDRLNPPEYPLDFEELTHSQICETLTCPIILWEALSVEGVADPYPGGKGFYEQRQNAIQHERIEDAIVLAVAARDFETLGEIVFDQVTEYAIGIIEKRS